MIFDLCNDLKLKVTKRNSTLYRFTIPAYDENYFSRVGRKAKTWHDLHRIGDLDLKVMHNQGHGTGYSALLLYHIKFGKNRLNGMGKVAKYLISILPLG